MGEYKDTHIGKIPIDWNVTELQYVTNDKDRYSFAGGPFGSDLKSEHYTEDGIRVIQLQNIGDGEFLNSSKVYTSVEKADELVKCNIYPGDIILAKMAEPVARACKIPDIEDRYLMCSDGIRVSVDTNEFDADYITYSINSDYFRNVAIARSTGTTRSRIGLGALRTIELLIPPLPEQKKIAKILSTVDGHIDEVDGMIEDLKELKKGLMQKLLTEGIGHTEFKDSEVGRIPVEWEVKTIDEISNKIVGGGTPSRKKDEYFKGSIPWITVKDLDGAFYKSSAIEYITEEAIENSSASLIKRGAVIIATRMGLGRGFINTVDLSINQDMKALTFKNDVLPEFFLYWYLSKAEFIEGLGKGSTVKGIRLDELRKLSLPIPEINEQSRICAIFSSIDNRLHEYSNMKEDAIILKKGLMQQLLTGKVRVMI